VYEKFNPARNALKPMCSGVTMSDLLMPKATAVWLIDNTALTFAQIADFCGLHDLEVQAIADGDVGAGIQGYNPILNKQLTEDEIKRCEADPSSRLSRESSALPEPTARTKGPRYVPLARRGDKPDAIAWIVKHHPNIKDSQISKLIGTTKDTIGKIRDRSHWNIANISAKHPVMLGLCSQQDLDLAIEKSGGTAQPPEEQVTNISELP
jgi:hypothetical protein